MSIFRSLCFLFSSCYIFNLFPSAAQGPASLPQLETCSVFLPDDHIDFCTVHRDGQTPDSPATLTLDLTVTTGPITVGGYKVEETQNYNGTYIGPLVELRPGDLFKVRFLNALSPAGPQLGRHHHGQAVPSASDNTNLHTHGLIVSPNNATASTKGDGDNIFAQLGRGQSLDYNIKIPTALPASILDLPSGIIPHPTGLYWYHAHLHGISASQLSGGMSGLISIGRPDANVAGPDAASTEALRAKTDVAHLLLRDIQITSAIAPEKAASAPAVWTPVEDPTLCENTTIAAASRPGFCTGSDPTKIWLFTVNGLRFPSWDIQGGRNLLLRIANTSASATYELSLINQDAPNVRIPFELLSVDGVVPTTRSNASSSPIAPTTDALRLMPAGRAEIYIRNDAASPNMRRLVLTTEGLHTGIDSSSGDNWPEINLAQLILEPSAPSLAATRTTLASQAVLSKTLQHRLETDFIASTPTPPGCIRDMDSTKLEHRRITFTQRADGWGVRSELVAPPDLSGVHPFGTFKPVAGTTVGPIPFERYLKDDGSVNWGGTDVGSNPKSPKHVCVSLKTGHAQLWEVSNPTSELHNFHIHQSKFRIATADDLRRYGIDPQGIVANLTPKLQNAKGTDDLYIWHDTMPVEAQKRVFLVINFDAEEQIGRFVFHCHILEHEDSGLMAPIEVLP
jgi:FtsP/CotA-like multicopper oxidase with cupredoxin domain